jgi:hypothetical protein
LFPRQIIDPFPIRLHGLPFAHRVRQVEPANGISYRADLVADGLGRVATHAIVQRVIGQEFMQMLGDGLVVARLDEESVLFMLYLKRDAASSGGDDGDAFV